MSAKHESENISPTAHYTGYIWYRNGLGLPELSTTEGKILYTLLRPGDFLAEKMAGGISLEKSLLQRHRMIDHLLREFIRDTGEKNAQVLEIAGGLSPRGVRFCREYPNLTYVESDLTGIHRRKKKILEKMDVPKNLRLVVLDILKKEGPESLPSALQYFDTSKPIFIILEGLLGYFQQDMVEEAMRNLAAFGRHFSGATIVADLYLDEVSDRAGVIELFRRLLSTFVRSPVIYTYKTLEEGLARLLETGLKEVSFLDPEKFVGVNEIPKVTGDSALFRILRATV